MKKYKWIFVFSLLATYFWPNLTINVQPTLAQQSNISCISLNKSKDFYQFENGKNDYLEQAHSVFWSPDSKKIAVWLERIDITKVISDPESWLQVWDTTTGSTIAKLKLDLYSYVQNVVWSSDSTKMAVNLRNKIRIWDGEQDWSPKVLSISSTSLFTDMQWSNDATQLYTTNTVQSSHRPQGAYQYGNVLHRWDVTSGEILEESQTFDQILLTKNEDQRIIISSVDNELSLRNANTNQVLWSQPNVYLAGSIFNKQVQRLATIMPKADSTIFSVWDLQTNKNLLNITDKYYRYPYLYFAPSGKLVESTTGSLTGAEIWDLETGQQVSLPIIKEYTWKKTFWSPTQDCAISVGSNPPSAPWRAILLWSFANPLEGHLLTENNWGYETLMWSLDGNQVAVIERTEVAENPNNVASPPLQFSSKLVIWSADN